MTTRRSILFVSLIALLVAACPGESTPAYDEPATSTTSAPLASSGATYTFPVGSLIIPMEPTTRTTACSWDTARLHLLQNQIPSAG